MKWYMNEERELLQAAFRDYAQTKVRPHVDKMEREEADAKDLLLEMGKLGFFALGKDEKCGGAGKDYINVGLHLEELAKESYTVAFLSAINHAFIQELILCGTEEQKKKYVEPYINGEIIFALASNEATGGGYFDGYSTKAKRDGDDWIINGTKVLITEADVTDYYMVGTLTADHFDPMTGAGYDCFIVPKNAEGVSTGHIEEKLGWKGSRTGTVYFDNVRVSEAEHFPIPVFTKPGGGIGAFYAACDLGGCEVILEKTTKFLKERIQYGASLWDAHEAIRNEVAALTARVSVFRNALFSHLMNLSIGADDFIEDFALKIDGVKLLREVATECMSLMGGTGYIYETGLERYYRDVQLSDVGCGSNKTSLSWIAATL